MKREKDYKAEDLLMSSISREGSNVIDPEQQQLAKDIQEVIAASGNERLPEDEKQQLWQRIQANKSKKAEKGGFRYGWIKWAAMIVLVSGAAIWVWMDKTSGIDQMELEAEKFAIGKGGETQLILSDHQSLSLKGESSNVAYQQNGHVSVDALGVVAQTASDGKNLFNTLLVPYGKRAELTLTDGTHVWLNAGSKLVYPVVFNGDKRQVYLEGEAFFDIKEDVNKPFHVNTKHTQITVLGTKFNVSAYPDEKKSYTVLSQGSIELTANRKALIGGVRKRLVPGNLLIWEQDKAEMQLRAVNPDDYTSWIDGYVILKSVPLAEILKKLERFYKVEIDVQHVNIVKETFSGRLDLKQNINEAMDIICASTSLHYQLVKGRIELDSK